MRAYEGPFPKYEWTVVFRNDRMGFVKTRKVEAINWKDAAHAADAELEKQMGDASAELVVIEIKRGREVGT